MTIDDAVQAQEVTPVIMVDEIRKWPHARGVFRPGACHLTVDGETPHHIKALHAFAARIGLKRSWFQNKRTPHYDLTIGKRDSSRSDQPARRASSCSATRAAASDASHRCRPSAGSPPMAD